jgi:hypothetical protein
MVSIILDNHASSQTLSRVTIKIAASTNVCELTYFDGRIETVETKAFLAQKPLLFEHPLLSATIAPKINGEYCVQYEDMDALSKVGTCFYATLIRKAPAVKAIRVQYTGKQLAPPYLPFSIDSKKPAKATLTLSQFEEFVRTRFLGEGFRWFDGISLDEMITLEDLPETVNASLLEEGELFSSKWLCESPPVEIRHISDEIGLGVYANASIAEGVRLFIYAGGMSSKKERIKDYIFTIDDHCFNRDVDARREGNYTRFINHATSPPQKEMLSPNLRREYKSYFGITMVVYVSMRPIEKGEQLLVDYGPGYWNKSKVHFFERGRKESVLTPDGVRLKEANTTSRETFRYMALSGISEAQIKIMKRPVISLLTFIVLFYLINHYG